MSDREPTAGPPSLPVDALRWRCDEAQLDFVSTADVEPVVGVIGQDTAVEALRFGLASRGPGQNIFVRGLTGTGRMTMLRRLLEDLRPTCPQARDRCYVHNFAAPDRPRLISLPRGRARYFRRRMDELADFMRDELGGALEAEGVRARKAALDQAAQEKVSSIVGPFEKELEAKGLAFVTFPVGPVIHTAIFPRVDGEPVPPEQFAKLHQEGKVDGTHFQIINELRESFHGRLEEVSRQVQEVRREHADEVEQLMQGEARAILSSFLKRIRNEFADADVESFLKEVLEDVVDNRLEMLGEDVDFTRLYRVNVVLEHADESCPIIIEDSPTLLNLLGAVDREVAPTGASRTDHLMISGGSLLRADGGYLVVEAREVLSEPGAWRVLIRTLRSGRLHIVPPEMALPFWGASLKPEPIDLDVKVILLGDAEIYHLLDAADADFPQLFKILADFDSTITRDAPGVQRYAGILARIARDEDLPPFDRSAVATLVEHGARIAARRDKLTARFGRLADIAREAAFLATRDGRMAVTGDDVREAIRRGKRRADLPSRRFRELLIDGTIRVQTRGEAVGQINGLAVLRSGPLTFGFPARITATIGPGTAGVINIEREAALSGAIHTKGFYILGGLLRRLLQTDHPLAFDASVAFEQSYGGIDGDSASGAEICCLLSALTALPLRQDLAMTGAIDQIGNILAIGAANEKIEGFFDVCLEAGLTGSQGVLIPATNQGDLMLREDIVEACAQGRFHVFAVQTVNEALTLLTGRPAGERTDGAYPEGTVLAMAVREAKRYWHEAAPARR